MSLYSNTLRIGGVPCGVVTRGSHNGRYLAVFEREFASLEDIEAISWDKPDIQGECILPAGYGFTVADIQYAAATRSYAVELQVADQYLGDVAGYEAQVSELESQVADLQVKAKDMESKEATIQSQQETIESQAANLAEKESTIESQAADLAAKEETIQTQAADLAEKESTIESQQQTIDTLQASGTAQQVEEKLEAAYQEGVESNG